jgi:hypothetical protein
MPGPKEHRLSNCKALAAIFVAAPLFAQYGGPALLTRGQAPAAMAASQIDFRPFLSIGGGYDTGLNGVGLDPNGKPVSVSSYSVEASGGISGLHSWKHTQVGLDYRASIRHYPGRSFYDGTDQSLLLGITHQVTRHVILSINTSAGLASHNFDQLALPQTVPFDRSTTYVPTNDFFDNRTMYFSNQTTLQVQKSTRLSYSVGVDGFITRRRSTALYGVSGAGAHSDIQYRVSRRSTIGAGYQYTHYSFNHIFSSTDLHAIVGSYANRISRSLEFSGTAGATLYETKFVQTVPVDPAIAILIGLTSVRQVTYSKKWIPSMSGRLAYTMKRGVAYINGGRSVTPGNGLFLTSTATVAGVGYTYTGLRRWSANFAATYNNSNSLGNFVGNYGSYSGTASLSRQIVRFTHGVLSFDARKYDSPDFRNYNKWSYRLQMALSFAPGDVPLRLW